jgi:hypothetical protein
MPSTNKTIGGASIFVSFVGFCGQKAAKQTKAKCKIAATASLVRMIADRFIAKGCATTKAQRWRRQGASIVAVT